jgi:hypothetical protein
MIQFRLEILDLLIVFLSSIEIDYDLFYNIYLYWNINFIYFSVFNNIKNIPDNLIETCYIFENILFNIEITFIG